jgi:integrase
MIGRIAARTGIGFTAHMLRHSHATGMIMSRVTSDASFRRIREPVWPAVLFTAGQAAAGRAMW